MKLPTLLCLLCVSAIGSGGLPSQLAGQTPESKFSLGPLGGADVSDNDVKWFLGGIGVFQPVSYVSVALTGAALVGEPFNALWFTLSARVSPRGGRVKPYVGAGLVVERLSFEGSSSSDVNWMAQAGLEFKQRRFQPFGELRLLGTPGTPTQILVGFHVGLH